MNIFPANLVRCQSPVLFLERDGQFSELVVWPTAWREDFQ